MFAVVRPQGLLRTVLHRPRGPRLCRTRSIHTTTPSLKAQSGRSREQQPGTDLNELNVLGNTPAPSTSVDVCLYDGFELNSGITISGGDGAMLVNGEAFAWRPWETRGTMELVNAKGQFEVPVEAFGLLDVLWPRPGKASELPLLGTWPRPWHPHVAAPWPPLFSD